MSGCAGEGVKVQQGSHISVGQICEDQKEATGPIFLSATSTIFRSLYFRSNQGAFVKMGSTERCLYFAALWRQTEPVFDVNTRSNTSLKTSITQERC